MITTDSTENNEITSSQQKGLTPVWQGVILYGKESKNERVTNDTDGRNGAEKLSEVSGLVNAQENEISSKISLRFTTNGQENQRSVHHADVSFGAINRRASDPKISQDKVKATGWWHWTVENLVFRTSHRRSAKLMRDGPRYSVPTFSIYNARRKIKSGLCNTRVQDGKSIVMEPEMKLCPSCKESKPLNNFSKDRTKKDELKSYCKECANPKVKQWREKHPEKRSTSEKRSTFLKPDPFTPEELRECYVDQRMSQRDIAAYFHCDITRVRAAMRREGIVARKHNVTRKKANRKPKYDFNYDEMYDLYVVKGISAKKIAKKLQISDMTVASYLKKLDIPLKWKKRHCPRKDRELHYKGILESFYLNYRYGAKTRNYSFELTLCEFESLVTKPCFFCGRPPSQKKSKYLFSGIDRSDNTMGYEPNNVRPCCGICNRAKNAMPEAEFIQWILQVADHLRENFCRDQEVVE